MSGVYSWWIPVSLCLSLVGLGFMWGWIMRAWKEEHAQGSRVRSR